MNGNGVKVNLLAVDNVKLSLRTIVRYVTGFQPAIGCECVCGSLRIVVISFANVRCTNVKLSSLVSRKLNCAVFAVNDL
jgi:hypothetical protein